MDVNVCVCVCVCVCACVCCSAGATGLIGQRLVQRLAAEGHQCRVLTRSPSSATKQFVGIPHVSIHGMGDWAKVRGCGFTPASLLVDMMGVCDVCLGFM